MGLAQLRVGQPLGPWTGSRLWLGNQSLKRKKTPVPTSPGCHPTDDLRALRGRQSLTQRGQIADRDLRFWPVALMGATADAPTSLSPT